ncbi:MAG: DNA repair protein RadA [Ruminococcus sp.]|nr:DNA repair protein RadA [Ruminococcus sp.]
MAKSKMVYRCTECGFETSKWNGRCPSCGTWNSLEEDILMPSPVGRAGGASRKKTDLSDRIQELNSITTDDDVRYHTGCGELDRVLGGGLVKGSIVLIGGEPGIGKSTLLLQICQYLGEEHSVLYVSGEESARQIKLRAKRLGVDTESLYLLTATDAQSICDTIVSCEPDIVIIDSIQTMQIPEIASSPGSLTQVRECTNLFMQTAKTQEIPIFIVGHVNKEGTIAGPKVIEHIVDTVLHFEGERHLSYRLLRAIKNRFGSTNEVGVFEMVSKGLQEVPNPSAMLLSERPLDVSGTCVTCVLEGTRPILAEVQVLATKSGFASPRRTSNGIDYSRMTIIIAILEKHLGFLFNTLDVYLNVVGGFQLREPSGDLAVAMCLYSSLVDRPINPRLAAFGEIGLGGEIRSVSYLQQRLREAERLGFELCIVPKHSLEKIDTSIFRMKVVGVTTLKQAFAVLNKTFPSKTEE